MRREGAALLKAAAGGALILRRAESWDSMTQDWVLEALETPRGDCPRILATARSDVGQHVRSELLSYLAVGRVDMPPLRKRGEDRALLFAHFLRHAATPRDLGPDATAFINAQVWRGEVLELRRVALRLNAQGERGPVRVEEIQTAMSEFVELDPQQDLTAAAARFYGACEALSIPDIANAAQLAVDRGLIESALEATGGIRQDAAKRLGLNRNTLTRRLSALGLGDDT